MHHATQRRNEIEKQILESLVARDFKHATTLAKVLQREYTGWRLPSGIPYRDHLRWGLDQ